jgi:Cu/Ag efflux pump CusA
MPENNDIFESASPEEIRWVKLLRHLADKSVESVEEAAKQLIFGVNIVLAVYIAILGLGSFGEALKKSILSTALGISPIALLLISLYCGLIVLKPEEKIFYSKNPDDCKRVYMEIIKYKQEYLNKAYTFLIFSLVMIVVTFFML